MDNGQVSAAMEYGRIGTPLTSGATRVMLLGAGELGKEVIIAFQRLGVEVIAVDRYDNAPGHQVAHHCFTIDMSDSEELLALIDAQQPDFVVPEIEAIATDALAEVEQREANRPEHIRLETRLIIRASTGPAPHQRQEVPWAN